MFTGRNFKAILTFLFDRRSSQLSPQIIHSDQHQTRFKIRLWPLISLVPISVPTKWFYISDFNFKPSDLIFTFDFHFCFGNHWDHRKSVLHNRLIDFQIKQPNNVLRLHKLILTFHTLTNCSSIVHHRTPKIAFNNHTIEMRNRLSKSNQTTQSDNKIKIDFANDTILTSRLKDRKRVINQIGTMINLIE